MDREKLRQLLEAVRAGKVSPDEALRKMAVLPFEDLGFVRLDHHRGLRCGFSEVVFCEGKTPEQVVRIAERQRSREVAVLATRARPAVRRALTAAFPEAVENPVARTVRLGEVKTDESLEPVVIVCAGTSDLPVAEEAKETLLALGMPVRTITDVGVAGLHRLLAELEGLQAAGVVIAVAGMEGALPSVVGGLVACPVIAVPTSVGYGAAFRGVAALLGILNSCASGVVVVNIDNGFGAACAAARIGRRIGASRPGIRP